MLSQIILAGMMLTRRFLKQTVNHKSFAFRLCGDVFAAKLLIHIGDAQGAAEGVEKVGATQEDANVGGIRGAAIQGASVAYTAGYVGKALIHTRRQISHR